MERKEYLERVMDVKNDILGEIREILGEGNTHYYANLFYVHYVDGEVAATEICAAVEVEKSGSIIFHVRPEGEKETEMVCGESVFEYEPESFMDILFNLKKEVREEKLSRLRKIVEDANGEIKFDGNFQFDGNDGETIILDCHLNAIKLVDGVLHISNTFEGDKYVNEESFIDEESLDAVIEYVKKTVTKTYTARIAGTFTRTFQVTASSYEKAMELAKKEWENHPLEPADANGYDITLHNYFPPKK